MNTDEAKAALKEDQDARTKATASAIEAALKEYSCDLVAIPAISADGKIVASIQIIAR